MPKSQGLLLREAQAIIDEDAGVIKNEEVFVGLFVDGPSVNPPTAVAHFTLPSGGNYIPIAAGTLTGPNLRDDGRVSLTLSNLQWVGDVDDLPITFTGFYVKENTGATAILAWRLFDTPIVFTSILSLLQLTVRLSLSNPAENVEVTVVNG